MRVPARFLKTAFLKSVTTYMDPLHASAAAINDFVTRTDTRKVRKTNPALEFSSFVERASKEKPRVEVTYVDGTKETLVVEPGWQALDIMKRINVQCHKINEGIEDTHAKAWASQFQSQK